MRMYFCHQRVFCLTLCDIVHFILRDEPKCPADALVSDVFLSLTENHRLAPTFLRDFEYDAFDW